MLLPDPPEFAAERALLLLSEVHRADHPDVRDYVRRRARDAGEYCLMPTRGRFEVEHIIPPGRWDAYEANALDAVPYVPGRRGAHHIENYAWACRYCNSTKAFEVDEPFGPARARTRLFDPRQDVWSDYFAFAPNRTVIRGIHPIGRVTMRQLRFQAGGEVGPLVARLEARLRGEYPPPWVW